MRIKTLPVGEKVIVRTLAGEQIQCTLTGVQGIEGAVRCEAVGKAQAGDERRFYFKPDVSMHFKLNGLWAIGERSQNGL